MNHLRVELDFSNIRASNYYLYLHLSIHLMIVNLLKSSRTVSKLISKELITKFQTTVCILSISYHVGTIFTPLPILARGFTSIERIKKALPNFATGTISEIINDEELCSRSLTVFDCLSSCHPGNLVSLDCISSFT
jgi:hypothetical protein